MKHVASNGAGAFSGALAPHLRPGIKAIDRLMHSLPPLARLGG